MSNKATPEMIQLPLKQWKKIEAALLTKDRPVMINEDEAAALLGIRKTTLIKKRCIGEIPPSFYTTSPVNGNRFYSKDKLMGL